jgi:hypothetical protein
VVVFNFVFDCGQLLIGLVGSWYIWHVSNSNSNSGISDFPPFCSEFAVHS